MIHKSGKCNQVGLDSKRKQADISLFKKHLYFYGHVKKIHW